MPPSKHGRKHEPGSSNESSTAEAKEPRVNLFRRLLGQREKRVLSNAKPVASSTSRSSHTQERPREDGQEVCLAPTAPGNDLPKDQGATNTITTLWDQAYDALKKDKPKLVEDYEELLSKELRGTGSFHAESRKASTTD